MGRKLHGHVWWNRITNQFYQNSDVSVWINQCDIHYVTFQNCFPSSTFFITCIALCNMESIIPATCTKKSTEVGTHNKKNLWQPSVKPSPCTSCKCIWPPKFSKKLSRTLCNDSKCTSFTHSLNDHPTYEAATREELFKNYVMKRIPETESICNLEKRNE